MAHQPNQSKNKIKIKLQTIPQVYPSHAKSSPYIPPSLGYTPLSATRPRHLRQTKKVQAMSTLDFPYRLTTF